MASSCWESASFARGREFEPGLRHKKRPHMEASSMLDKSFCAKPDKRVWLTTALFKMVDLRGSNRNPLPVTFSGQGFFVFLNLSLLSNTRGLMVLTS